MRHEDLSALSRGLSHIQFLVRDLRYEIACQRLLAELRRAEGKANFNPAQPRAPRGTSIGGQWVGSDSEQPPSAGSPPLTRRRLRDGGVYRRGDASLWLAAGGGSRSRFGGNRPPPDHPTLQEVFPMLPNAPPGAILAPIDNFLGLSAPGEAANLAATQLQVRALDNEIRAIDPSYQRPRSLQSLEQMSWQSRSAYIGEMRLDRAAALYNIHGKIEPLQVETLRFLQRRVDVRYEEAVIKYEAGELDVHLGRNEAIGNYIDSHVRADLREMYGYRRVEVTLGKQVRVNRRAYYTTGSELTFKVPDVRVGRVAYDMTMSRKLPGSGQIRGFFNADFRPLAVIIVRPSALGKNHTYVITPPSTRDGR